MMRKLAEVGQDAAGLAGERQNALSVVLTGRTLFLYATSPKDFPRRDGTGVTSVVSFKTWTPRGGDALWMEVRDPAHIELVQSLLEGEQIAIAGQLVVKPRKLGGLFVSVRVYEIGRA